MPTFSGSLEVADPPGQGVPVRVTIVGDHVGLAAESGGLGSWSLSEMKFARTVEGLTLTVDGEAFRLVLQDPDGFWSAISTADTTPVDQIATEKSQVPPWWRFWSTNSWRAWWARRGSWAEYRKVARTLDRRIAELTRSKNINEAALEQARKNLAWARDVGSQDVPIRTAKAEIGLAAVPGVTLLETRKKDGNDAWTMVDSGSVFFTDRKMVFSGRKEVQFPFDKITMAGPRNEGLHVVVSSRKRDHILSGPAEQLLVVLDACRAAGRGEPPTAWPEASIASLAASIEADAVEREEVRARRAALVAPPRPLSPAWIPAAALVILLGALGAVADDDGGPKIGGPPLTTDAAAAINPPLTAVPATVTTVGASSPSPVSAPAADITTATATTTDGAPAAVGDIEVAGELVAYFFDVGQGDATLLTGPDFTILIDAGRHDPSDLFGHLQESGAERIDLLVGTHPHADHIGQFPEVLAAYPVTEVWMSGDSHTTQTFERALDAIEGSDAGYNEPRAGESYNVGSALVEIVNPTSTSGDLHDGTIALRITFGDVAFLFTGDAETGTEEAMIQRGHDVTADVLQVGHHGSSTSTSDAFLEAVGPGIAVYSAGAGNQYGHPDGGVLARLLERGVEVFGTDVHGTVVITTDGSTLSVDTANTATITASEPTTTVAIVTTTATTDPAEEASACGTGLVDINSAGFEELQAIIHIGPDRADQILRLRPFRSVDSMDRIKGIGAVRLADIKEQGVACAG